MAATTMDRREREVTSFMSQIGDALRVGIFSGHWNEYSSGESIFRQPQQGAAGMLSYEFQNESFSRVVEGTLWLERFVLCAHREKRNPLASTPWF